MVNHKVPMAVLYLVAWQDTAKPSTHLNPVVVEVCQAVRFHLKFQFLLISAVHGPLAE